MKNIINWFKNNRDSIIRNSFLLPILLVVIMSISHVVSWYDIGNPMSWAIYLSVAIEIFALASVAAASIDIKKGSIWFLFGLVTFIQIVGNIFFGYQDINVTDPNFLSWVELVQPAFSDWDIIDHRRLLATIQGGTLPLMSLTALHFFIKFSEKKIKAENLFVAEIDAISDNLDESIKQHINEEGNIDAVATLTKILNEELEKSAMAEQFKAQQDLLKETIESAQNQIEPIDEEAFLNQVLPEKEISVIEIEPLSKETLSETLNTLKELEQAEENILKPSNESDSIDEKDSFGPPQINNGQI